MSTDAGPVLRDIHLPPPPGWWPLAPGWWGLIVLFMLILLALYWYGWRPRMRRRRWRAANRELDLLLEKHARQPAEFAAGVSQLLRRAARLQRPSSANLHGAAWQRVLRELGPDADSVCPLLTLEQSLYRRHADLDVEAVAAAARIWLRHVLLQRRRRPRRRGFGKGGPHRA